MALLESILAKRLRSDALDSLLQQVRAARCGAWGTFTVQGSSPHNCRLAGSGCSMGDPRLEMHKVFGIE